MGACPLACSQRNHGTVTIPRYRLNQSKQHTLKLIDSLDNAHRNVKSSPFSTIIPKASVPTLSCHHTNIYTYIYIHVLSYVFICAHTHTCIYIYMYKLKMHTAHGPADMKGLGVAIREIVSWVCLVIVLNERRAGQCIPSTLFRDIGFNRSLNKKKGKRKGNGNGNRKRNLPNPNRASMQCKGKNSSTHQPNTL